MTNQDATKVLIVVFDALRPEFVRPDLMPHLHEFASRGVGYQNSRSTFPTETRVNQTAVLTGCYPRKHGIVGNRFPEPGIAADRVVNTGVDAEVAEAFAKAPCGLIQMPTMGEHLQAAGRTFAALSAGTPGGGRLINHRAGDHGTFRLAMRCPEAAQPPGVLEAIVARIGPMPEYQLPAIDWINWAINAYLEFIVPTIDPDVMLLWLCEPDESFHFLGIGHEGSLAAMKNADTQFGRILADRASAIEAGGMQIIAMSDHGQISLSGEPLDLPERLCSAGYNAGSNPGPDVDFTVVAGNAGGIWMNQPDDSKLASLVDWLMHQVWCGPLFTHTGIGGTLTNKDICTDHRRAPDITINMNYGSDPNQWGHAGTSRHDAPYPVGGGCHGGLSPYELHNVLTMSGSCFRQSVSLSEPAANTDILPTVFSLLGLPPVKGVDGRILTEALNGGYAEDLGDLRAHILTAANGHTHLAVTDYGPHRYLDKAWIE